MTHHVQLMHGYLGYVVCFFLLHIIMYNNNRLNSLSHPSRINKTEKNCKKKNLPDKCVLIFNKYTENKI